MRDFIKDSYICVFLISTFTNHYIPPKYVSDRIKKMGEQEKSGLKMARLLMVLGSHSPLFVLWATRR
jgi:hypothetical protein